MAFRLEESEESHNASFALFDTPPVDSSIDQREWIEYRPISQITADSVVEFNIPGTSTNYVNLKESRLHVKLRIRKKDGALVDTVDKIALVNIPLQALWTQVDLSLQQQVISSVGTNYPYKAYLDILLNKSRLAKQTQLQSQLFYKDDAGHFDDPDPVGGSNLGLARRWSYTNKGELVDLEGPIFNDLCSQNRYILNGIQIGIKLWPHKDPFRLMASKDTEGAKVELVDVTFKVCTIKVSPGLQIGHAEALKVSPALYPYEKSSIKTFSIPKSYLDISIDDIYQGDVPSSLIIGLLNSDGYNGSYSKNPFNFAHFYLSYIGFFIDGQSVPAKPIQPNYLHDRYVDAYLSLFTSNGNYMLDKGNYITRSDYPNGYCLYMFNINDTDKNENQLPLIKKGHTRLNIQFNKSLDSNCTVMIYGKFPSILRIDEARNIIQ